MMRNLGLWAAAAVCLAGCGKKEAVAHAGDPAVEASLEAVPVVATHLGFATRVPADADLYFAGFGADEMIGGSLRSFISKWAGRETDADKARETDEKLREGMLYVGDEAFVFVGPGAGIHLQTIGRSYRDLSAAWTGFAVGSLLDLAAGKESAGDGSLSEELSGELAEKWLAALEKDSRLQVPSVVMGWRPDPAKLDECRDALERGVAMMLDDDSPAAPVHFETSGCQLAGIEVSGRELFGELLEKARDEIANQDGADEVLERISPQQVERLLEALENLRLTIAVGAVDGRVLVYLGNGAEGFRLASEPETSLAASGELRWSGRFADKKVRGSAYLSGEMIRAALPWLDTSDYWTSLSASIRPPVHEERLLRELLAAIATTEADLAKRDVSAWSAVVIEDEGWRVETRGGWPNPALDYETPLKMTDAAQARNPVIRAHWVQNRDRNNLSWRQVEQFGLLVDAVLEEFQASGNPAAAMMPEGVVPRVMEELRGINKTYREEFRAGIGDEVAVVVDLQGEMPPVPGASEETLKDARVPRFIVARPVTDRAMIDAAGRSSVQRWKGLTAWATELSGEELPLILPQSVESDGLVTWYPPLPFIGGDFLPGVSLNDDLWILGTSRSMAGGFAKSLATASSGGETGMILEVDFQPVWEWFGDIYRRNEGRAEALAGDAPDELKELASEKNREQVLRSIRRLKGVSYRQWLADGTPRTSLHLRVLPGE